MIRLHVPHDLAGGVAVAPAQDQVHYLVNVMRQGAGDAVLVFNGRDGEWRARLVPVGKRGMALLPEERVRAQAFGPDLDLVVAVVKRARLETIVEKAAELGCRRVRLVLTRRTNADRARLERLQAIAIEASEQTGRLDAPEVIGPEKLTKVLDDWDAGRRLMFCDEAAVDPDFLPNLPPHKGAGGLLVRPALDALAGAPPGPWAVLIGPEGGFDPEEQARLRGLAFVIPVALGPRILRADTAAISALTLWQAKLGDWRTPPVP
jgi:16S rRNA (uracil1498-N3)-methyltransferase